MHFTGHSRRAMTAVGGVDRAPSKSAPGSVLALLFAVSGALCLVGAVLPMDARTPVLLLTVLGVVGLAISGTLWAIGSGLGTVGPHAGIGLMTALIGVLAWRSATALGIVGLRPALLAVSLYVGHFLTLRVARVHVLALICVASVGAWAAVPSGFLVPWL